MRRDLKATGVLAAVAVTLLAGCGGGGSGSNQTAQFKTGLKPVVDQFGNISHAIGTAIQQAPSRTDVQLATTFRALAGQWQNQLSQLQTLKAPSNLAAAFNTLTGAASRTEADLTAVATAAGTHSADAAKQASASLVTDILAAKAAATTITDKLGIK